MKAYIDKRKCYSDNLGSRMEIDHEKCTGCGICVSLCCGDCIELN